MLWKRLLFASRRRSLARPRALVALRPPREGSEVLQQRRRGLLHPLTSAFPPGRAWLSGAGRVRFTRHARTRAGGSTVGELHVVHALKLATACVPSDAKWRVSGPDLDGDEVTAVVALEAGVIVVTVF